MSNSNPWPPSASGTFHGRDILMASNASSGLQKLAQSTVAIGDECPQLDNEQLYVSMSTFWYLFLAFITTLGLLVSLVSNTIIIYLFTKTPSLRRNPSNIIAVNLSLSDLLYCIQWPSVIYCSLSQSTWMLEIDLPAPVCQTFGFLTVSTAWASILTVVAMSIERAIVIGYSVHAKSRFTIRCAWLIVVLIWIIAICSSLPPLFGKFNRYTLDPSKTSCTLDYLSNKANYKLYILVLYIAYWITPAILITICYVAIIVTFKRSSRSLRLVGESSSGTVTASQLLSTSAGGQLENELAPISDAAAASQPATRRSSPLAWHFGGRSDGRRQFGFKLSQRQLRDSIRLRNLAGSFKLRRRARSGGQNSTASSSPTPDLASPPGNQLECSQTGHPSRFQMPRAPEQREFEGASSSSSSLAVAMLEAREKVNLIQSAAVGARIMAVNQHQEPAGHDWMQIVAERAPLGRRDVTSPAHLTAAASVTSRGGEQAGDIRASAADRNKQLAELASARRRYSSSSRPCNIAAATLVEVDTFKDTFVQVTAAPLGERCAGRGKRVGMRRSRTSQDLRAAGDKTGGRLSDATTTFGLQRKSSSQLRLQSHRFKATISGLVGGSRQTTPRPSQQRQALTSSSSCHIGGTSGSHLSRTGLQIRLAKMAFYLILLWFVSWTPIASLVMIHSVFKCHHRASASAVFTANTMTKLGPAFDVFIYGISHPTIKSKFKKIIKWMFMIGRNGGGQTILTSRQPFNRSKQVSMRSNMS